jgi:hypothetical protein
VKDITILKTDVDPVSHEQRGSGLIHYDLSSSGINSAIEATSVICQVNINNVIYDSALTPSLESYMELSKVENNGFLPQPRPSRERIYETPTSYQSQHRRTHRSDPNPVHRMNPTMLSHTGSLSSSSLLTSVNSLKQQQQQYPPQQPQQQQLQSQFSLKAFSGGEDDTSTSGASFLSSAPLPDGIKSSAPRSFQHSHRHQFASASLQHQQLPLPQQQQQQQPQSSQFSNSSSQSLLSQQLQQQQQPHQQQQDGQRQQRRASILPMSGTQPFHQGGGMPLLGIGDPRAQTKQQQIQRRVTEIQINQIQQLQQQHQQQQQQQQQHQSQRERESMSSLFGDQNGLNINAPSFLTSSSWMKSSDNGLSSDNSSDLVSSHGSSMHSTPRFNQNDALFRNESTATNNTSVLLRGLSGRGLGEEKVPQPSSSSLFPFLSSSSNPSLNLTSQGNASTVFTKAHSLLSESKSQQFDLPLPQLHLHGQLGQGNHPHSHHLSLFGTELGASAASSRGNYFLESTDNKF